LGGATQRSADAARLGDAVRWHGTLGRDALRALVDRADLLLVTSRHESGPLVVLEAAVAGVPTVGTAVGHLAEWAPRAAVAVPVGDAAALARETAALLADDGRRVALAAEAQRLALGMDADRTAASYERLYADVARP
jgi:glycosyltransferase involved in cell wall biosynthesis